MIKSLLVVCVVVLILFSGHCSKIDGANKHQRITKAVEFIMKDTFKDKFMLEYFKYPLDCIKIQDSSEFLFMPKSVYIDFINKDIKKIYNKYGDFWKFKDQLSKEFKKEFIDYSQSNCKSKYIITADFINDSVYCFLLNRDSVIIGPNRSLLYYIKYNSSDSIISSFIGTVFVD